MTERADDEVMLSVRVPVELRDAVARTAAQQNRTVSGQTRYWLAIAIEQQARQPATA